MARGNDKPRVLLCGQIDWAQEEWEALSDVATLEVPPKIGVLKQVADSKNREEFIKDLNGKYNGILAISRTFASVDVCPHKGFC
jgi:glyoxylate reductase